MNYKLFRSKEFTSSQSRKPVFLTADKHSPLFFISRTKQNDSIQVIVLNYLAKLKAPPDNFSVLQQNTA